jgi:hypothetical protein
VAPAGKDKINIKKAEPMRNGFIAPPTFVGMHYVRDILRS